MIFTIKCFTECPQFCTDQYFPICGTDGITYSNKCSMDSVACKKREAINVAYYGHCNPGEFAEKLKLREFHNIVMFMNL